MASSSTRNSGKLGSTEIVDDRLDVGAVVARLPQRSTSFAVDQGRATLELAFVLRR